MLLSVILVVLAHVLSVIRYAEKKREEELTGLIQKIFQSLHAMTLISCLTVRTAF